MRNFRPDLGPSLQLDNIYFPLWHNAIVENVDDPYDAGRIQVRIEGIDNKIITVNKKEDNFNTDSQTSAINDDNYPWCEPLLPKYLNVRPKKGELVRVCVYNFRNKNEKRMYIGPIVGQETYDDYKSPTELLTNSRLRKSFNSPWSKREDLTKIRGKDWSIWPNKDDIAIQGRANTDVILRNKPSYDEIILRAGKIDWKSVAGLTTINNERIPKINDKNPAYIVLNYSQPTNNQQERSHINIVAENLNLISQKGSSHKGLSPNIINDDAKEQINIEEKKLHPLVYGDFFWEFLSVLIPYIESHIHRGSRGDTVKDGTVTQTLLDFLKKNMGDSTAQQRSKNDFGTCTFLSKGVKTN